MRIFEKHKNGAIIDMDGEPERVAAILKEWRQYQDGKDAPRLPVGFVVEAGPSRIPPQDLLADRGD